MSAFKGILTLQKPGDKVDASFARQLVPEHDGTFQEHFDQSTPLSMMP
jgi:hypothetical protein